MDNSFKVKLNIDPNDKYIKAKKDLIEALNSINALPPQQQQQLAYELIGAEKMNLFISFMQQFFNNQR